MADFLQDNLLSVYISEEILILLLDCLQCKHFARVL